MKQLLHEHEIGYNVTILKQQAPNSKHEIIHFLKYSFQDYRQFICSQLILKNGIYQM